MNVKMKENPNTLYRKNFNQTRCNTPTRKRISEVESRIAEWDKHHAEIAQSNFAKYEPGKYLREDIDYQNMTSKGMRR